jgi:nitrilase
MQAADIGDELPEADLLRATADEVMADGGSCVAGPDGNWVLEPIVGHEQLSTVGIDHSRVLEERQSLDIVGHYSRPDVTKLVVSRQRQSTVSFDDD